MVASAGGADSPTVADLPSRPFFSFLHGFAHTIVAREHRRPIDIEKRQQAGQLPVSRQVTGLGLHAAPDRLPQRRRRATRTVRRRV